MIRKCIGCGAILQYEEIDKIGYVKEKKYDTALYCERCFKILNYGDFKHINSDGKEYIEIYKNINKTNDLVLFLVDIFNINDSISMINKYINNKVILVITKYDIIPRSVKEDKIKTRIKEYNFNSNIIDIIFVSSNTNYNINLLYEKMLENKTSNNVYLCGNTNAGKSTLINKLIEKYSVNKIKVTTSILPSTTININNIYINENLTLIDTPGFIESNNISNYVSIDLLKKIMPKNEIKPITYQLEEGMSLLIDNLLRIEYVNGEKNSFTFYISNDIMINRINTITNNRGRDLKCHDILVSGNEDVIVNGLCFIKITKKAVLKIYTIDGVLVFKRRSLI